MREVVDVVVYPEFGGDVHLDVGFGDGAEEGFFETVARRADGVDQDVDVVEAVCEVGWGVFAELEFGVGGDVEAGGGGLGAGKEDYGGEGVYEGCAEAVSYTHLTLPTTEE